MKLFAWRALALLAWSPVLLPALGCGNQLEGERCSKDHGNIDCDEGLTCKQVYVERWHWICCPVSPAPVKVAACNASGIPPGDGGTTVPDAAADARPEASTDTSARDLTGNDAVDEPIDDRSTVDRGADVSPDLSIDTSAPDVADTDARDAPTDPPFTPDQTSADGIDDSQPADAPLPDAAPDAPADVASEALPDGTDFDTMTPIEAGDVVDAPAEGGPG